MTQHENEFHNYARQPIELFSIYDVKVKEFMPPFVAKDTVDARRQVMQMVNYSNTLICSFPEDYILYSIGLFDLDSGEIINAQPKVIIDNLVELKTEKSIEYSNLLKEIQSSTMQLKSCISDYQNIHSQYEQKLRVLNSTIENNSKSIDLYQPKPSKKDTNNLLSKLFH